MRLTNGFLEKRWRTTRTWARYTLSGRECLGLNGTPPQWFGAVTDPRRNPGRTLRDGAGPGAGVRSDHHRRDSRSGAPVPEGCSSAAAEKTVHYPDRQRRRGRVSRQSAGRDQADPDSVRATSLQKWLNVAGPETRIIFTGDRDLLDRLAPEAIERRGAWRHFEIVDLDENPPDESPAAASPETGIDAFAAEYTSPAADDVPPAEGLLIRAFASRSTEERLELCQEARDAGRRSRGPRPWRSRAPAGKLTRSTGGGGRSIVRTSCRPAGKPPTTRTASSG